MISREFMDKVVANPPRRRGRKYRDVNVLFVGPQRSGKTTLLNLLLHKEVTRAVPTIGFNAESLSYAKYNHLTIYDIQGTGPAMRNTDSLHDTVNLQCVVLFIDVSAKRELFEHNDDPYSPYHVAERIIWGAQLDEEPGTGRFERLPILFVLSKSDLRDRFSLDVASERTLTDEGGAESPIQKLQNEELSRLVAEGLSSPKDFVSMSDVITRYRLLDLGLRRKWSIVESSSFTGHGVDNILKWITDVCV